MDDTANNRIYRCREDQSPSLNLSNLGLETIPEAVTALTHLKELDLSENELIRLPERLGNLSQLIKLQLHSNQVTTLPESVGALGKLREINLSANRLASLPESCGDLSMLSRLILRSNRLASLPEWVGRLRNLKLIDLSDNHLVSLPESLSGLVRLGYLNLGANQLTSLPDTMDSLIHLTELNLSKNRLTTLPESIGGLTQLTEFIASSNQLTTLPESIGRLACLSIIDLGFNPLTSLPESIGRLKSLQTIKVHPADKLAPEIQAADQQGDSFLISFLQELSTDAATIREAKLVFIGEGAAGKSSLLAALRGEQFDAQRSTTHGVEVKQLILETPEGEAITLNSWDFGGQKAYQPTHQLFFTAPAVYVVAWNPRQSSHERLLEDWINLVRQRVGDDVRIHIVATHSDPSGQQGALDEDRLKQLHGECIVGFHRIDSSNGLGIAELKSSLSRTAQALPHIQRRLPTRWRALLTALNESGESYIDYRTYLDKASENGLNSRSANALARVATELGHWCYYPEVKGLEDLVVLKGDWLSRAISFVLNDLATKQRNGLITHRRLSELWDDPTREPSDRYPKPLHEALRLLMREYQIAYQVRGHMAEPTSLISQMVPFVPPDLAEWRRFDASHQQTYVIKFLDSNRRPVIPPGLMFQLITWFHRYSLGNSDYDQSLHWAHGMVIDDGYNGRALVEIDDREQTISVTVKAHYPTYLCKLIANDICNQVSHWKGLTASIFIPCADQCVSPGRQWSGTTQFDSAMLFALKNRNRYEIDCATCYERIAIDLLIGESGISIAYDSDPVERRLTDINLRLDDVSRSIESQGLQTRSRIAQSEEHITTTIGSQMAEQTQQYLNLLADEAVNGPRLLTVERTPHDPMYKRATSRGWQIILWCEHSRVPVSVLDRDPSKGVYRFDVPKEWVQKAAPWIRFAGQILRISGDFAPTLLKLELDPDQYKQLEDRLKLAEITAKELAHSAEWVNNYSDSPFDIEAARASFKPSQLRTLHTEIVKRDPGFAGLQRVRDRDQFLWVHYSFAHLYE